MAFMDRWESGGCSQTRHGPTGGASNNPTVRRSLFSKVLTLSGIGLGDQSLSRSSDPRLRTKRPSPLARKALRLFTAGFLWMGKVIPDPKDTFTERRQVAHAAKRAAGASKTPDQQSEQAKVAGCPFHRFRAKPSASDAASPGTTQAKK